MEVYFCCCVFQQWEAWGWWQLCFPQMNSLCHPQIIASSSVFKMATPLLPFPRGKRKRIQDKGFFLRRRLEVIIDITSAYISLAGTNSRYHSCYNRGWEICLQLDNQKPSLNPGVQRTTGRCRVVIWTKVPCGETRELVPNTCSAHQATSPIPPSSLHKTFTACVHRTVSAPRWMFIIFNLHKVTI